MDDRDNAILNVRCPRCHNLIELIDDSPLSDIQCPSCGSHFSLLGDQSTAAYSPDEAKTIAHFELIEQVGVGQFGSVWKARDTQLDRTVAIKLPRQGKLDSSEGEQFIREARAAAQVRHSNIVSVHEVGRDGDSIYIVSDFIEGANLSEWLSRQRLSPREAVELCVKIADALHEAHEAGVTHRDLKPGNIMLSIDGEPYITDFGLAKRETGEITMTMDGRVLGTPAYMSPEQARGQAHEADRRSDVYSLGVILYELLTGELPFRGETRMLIVQILRDEPTNPRKLNGRLPRDLETICLKCLEKEPGKRYQSAKLLGDDLRRFLEGEVINARPVRRTERGWRWCKRNPVVAGLATAFIIAVVAGLGGVTSQWIRAEGEAERAMRIAAQEQKARQDAVEARDLAREEAEQRRRLLYVSDMNVACRALLENNLVRVEQLVHRHESRFREDYSAPFEWRFLRRILDEANAIPRMELPYLSRKIAFSPRDNVVAIGLVNRSVALVNVSDRKLLDVLGPGDLMWCRSLTLAFLGTEDLLAYSFGEGITFRHIESGSKISPPELAGHIKSIAVSSDGERFAALHDDKSVKILDANDFTLVGSFPLAGEAEFKSMALSSTGSVLAVSFADGRIAVVDVTTGHPLVTLPEQVIVYEGRLAFSRDGRLLAFAASNNSVHVWDWKKASRLCSLRGHTDRVYIVQFSPDGRRLASASRDNTVILWDMQSFHAERTLRGHSAAVSGLAFSHGGNLLATVSYDPEVRFWDLTRLPDPEIIHRASGHSVTNMAISPDGRTLGAICGRGRQTFPEGSESATGEVLFWDLTSGKSLAPLETGRDVFSLAFGSDDLLATGSEDGRIDFWNCRNGNRTRSVIAHTGNIRDLAFSPDGSLLASAGDDGTAKLWDVATGMEIPTEIVHVGRVRSVAFSPDGRKLATGGYDRTVKLWDVEARKLTELRPVHMSDILSLAFSPEGSRLVSSSWDGTINLWNLSDREAGPQTLRGHSMWVSAVRFSQDGNTLFSASGDHCVKIWDTGTAQERFTLDTTTAVTCMAISPNEDIVASGTSGGAIRLWRAATEEADSTDR